MFRFLLAALLMIVLTACIAQTAAQPQGAFLNTPDAGQQAALEATAMIEQAKATAMLIKAQAEATALIEKAGSSAPGPDVTATPQQLTEVESPAGPVKSEASPTPNATPDGSYFVEVVGVSYAADGKMIIVEYRASRSAVDDFWPGKLSVTDEVTGTVYESVPTMPVIGPLIGRTLTTDQVGYVMFDNIPPGLPPGSLVTVRLGKYQQEHVQVSQN